MTFSGTLGGTFGGTFERLYKIQEHLDLLLLFQHQLLDVHWLLFRLPSCWMVLTLKINWLCLNPLQRVVVHIFPEHEVCVFFHVNVDMAGCREASMTHQPADRGV